MPKKAAKQHPITSTIQSEKDVVDPKKNRKPLDQVRRGKRREVRTRLPMVERQKFDIPREIEKKPTAVTVMFDDADEYARFIDYVYENFGGRGLRLTNVPVLTSIRVTPWLLEQTQGSFNMRPVTTDDLVPALERAKGKGPFDPEIIRGLRIPGAPHREPRPRE